MDTVLVSVVSVLGTVVGAGLTAFIAARTERRRQAAQDTAEQQTRMHELRVEHQRWRRERRHGTYLAFLEAVSAADRANQEHFRHLRATPPGGVLDARRLAEIRQLFKAAEAVGHAVLLEGPDDVAEAALGLILRLSSLVRDIREYALAHAASHDRLDENGAECHEKGMAFIAQHKAFLGIARAALDEVIEVV
ncbi:hypothetical protein [Streptomyces platensis]|uniref:hypothetical protein n=1 Tax=Streptomyces platensis TaxID=58346 RepID=UPI0038662CE6|nr:hypothetical protein OG962_19560 [Streptomyces platensis]